MELKSAEIVDAVLDGKMLVFHPRFYEYVMLVSEKVWRTH